MKYNADNHYLVLFKLVYEFLQKHTASFGMINKATGFDQKEIRNIVRELERKGLARKVEKRRCKVAGSIAWYYTTKEKLFPVIGQPAKSNTIVGACLKQKTKI